MRFNPFRRRPAQPLRNNTLGQPMAGFSLPPRVELEPLPEEMPEELASSGLTPDQLMALMTLMQGASPAETDISTPTPGAVRKAVLTAPARAARPALDLTPEEEALVAKQTAALSAGPAAIRPRPERAFPRRMGEEQLAAAPVFRIAPRLQSQGASRAGMSLGMGRTRAEDRLAQLQNAGQMTALQGLLARAGGSVAPRSLNQLQNARQLTGAQALLMRLFPSLR